MTPNLRLVSGALVAGAALACGSPPREPARVEPPGTTSVATAEPQAGPEAPPTTFAEIGKLLARAEREPDAERKKTYALARTALTSLTQQPGRPTIVAQVRTESGREETRLLPQNRRVEVAPWQSGSLRVAGERVVTVGDRVVSLDAGRITIWGAEPVRIDAQGATTLSVPDGEPRFVLASGMSTAFVLDSQTGKTLLESPRQGASLARSKDGQTRFAHRVAGGAYELRDLPAGKVVEFSRLLAFDELRGLAAVTCRPEQPAGKGEAVCLVGADSGMVALQSVADVTISEFDARNARIGSDLATIFWLEGGEAKRFRFETGKTELLGKQSGREGRFELSRDSKHVCIDAPGDAIPRPRGPAGTTPRCYFADGSAWVTSLGPPPVGFRRLTRESAGADPARVYEIVSPEASLVAAILTDGKSGKGARFTVAVYDSKSGKQLWNQFLDTMTSPANPPSLSFSENGEHLLIDGVRLESGTGVAVDDKPVDSESLTPLMKRFGLNVGGKTLSLMRLGYDVPFFQAGQLVWTVDLAPRPLSIILDPVTLTMALRGHGSKQSIVFASGPTSAVAFLPDGSFAKSGQGSDLVCELGSVLAPIEVCQSKQEIPALRVPAALGDLSR